MGEALDPTKMKGNQNMDQTIFSNKIPSGVLLHIVLKPCSSKSNFVV